MANAADKSDHNGVAEDGKAFDLYANGTSFEVAAAFRAFDQPLRAGQAFSLLLEHGTFVCKFDADSPEPGSCGVTRLPDAAGASTGDYDKGARFEFGYLPAQGTYVVRDGDGCKKLDLRSPTPGWR